MKRKWGRQVRFGEAEPEALVAGALDAGLELLEWRAKTAHGVTIPETDLAADADFVSRLRQCSRAHGVAAAYHAPQGPAWHFGRLPFDLAVARMQTCIRRAHALGAALMTLHLGTDEQDFPESLRRGAKALEAVAPLAEEMGVWLCVENVFPYCSMTSAADCIELIEQVPSPRVRFTLDTGHAHVGGDLFDILDAMDGRVAFTHLHDNAGDADRHLVPGNGTIDWSHLTRGLDALGYDGPMNFELRQACDFPRTIAWLESLAGSTAPARATLPNTV